MVWPRNSKESRPLAKVAAYRRVRKLLCLSGRVRYIRACIYSCINSKYVCMCEGREGGERIYENEFNGAENFRGIVLEHGQYLNWRQ